MNDPELDKAKEFIYQEHSKVLEGMHPFTITITDPAEAAMLFNAALKGSVKWNNEASMLLAKLLAEYCGELGEEAGLTKFMEEMDQRGYKIPKWFKPLHNHLIGLATQNFKQFKQE